MKTIVKSTQEPNLLKQFRHSYPNAHWDKEINGNPKVDDSTYDQVLETCLEDQKFLCAYCEINLMPQGWPDYELRFIQRVEHYLAKSGHHPGVNLNLHWPNLLAVCTGGTQKVLENKFSPYVLKPIKKNESCDAFKNSLIQRTQNTPIHLKKIDEDCTGYILDPLKLPSLTNLFSIEMLSGKLIPHPKRCPKLIIIPNRMGTTEALVQNTIDVLNLNCDRLVQHRLKVIKGFNRNIKIYQNQGKPSDQIGRKIAKFYFSEQWPEFFTTLRCLIGRSAEDYLREIYYQG